ncbi:MAG: methyltransferase type 12 [Candidatus Margulisiibacteriota bacterium]|jgi:hypothetical protein
MIQNIIRPHKLTALIHNDPYTKRSFEKPCGYPGDASLLDYIFGVGYIDHNISEIGKKILSYTTNSPASTAVWNRAQLISQYIDNFADKKKNLRVLSLAAGHLREANFSTAIKNKKIDYFLAIDHDDKSLEVINNSYSKYGIETMTCSVFDLIRGKKNLEIKNFDFVYASGLYDYLSLRMATRLTKYMFDMLNPNGGKLLVTNFLPGTRDIGYMESFMDWNLIYRELDELNEFAKKIPIEEIKEKRLFRDELNNIAFLEITKICKI